jgi:ferrochelatase
MRFAPEPEHAHGNAPAAPRTAILLCNLGTPEAPTAPALRRYLAEFLGDPRVVEIPRLVWWPILHGVILRVRPARSARKYASIWTPEGSPLAVWTRKQALMLQGYLGERRCRVTVRHAMRYGAPSIPQVLDELKSAGATRVLVVPLYPQYASSTTAAVVDAVGRWSARQRVVPELRFVNHYHDDRGYIESLAKSVLDHAMIHGRPQKLVLSFHGLPRRSLKLGDPYHCECQKTARLLAERLGFEPGQILVTFQSRFGRAEWLQPYTEPTLVALAREGTERVDVMCPGFSTDCLETLEEIDQEARHAFMAAGGREFHYIPCLNDRHEWIVALSEIAMRHLQGWPTITEDAAERARQRERAMGMGAAH